MLLMSAVSYLGPLNEHFMLSRANLLLVVVLLRYTSQVSVRITQFICDYSGRLICFRVVAPKPV